MDNIPPEEKLKLARLGLEDVSVDSDIWHQYRKEAMDEIDLRLLHR